MSSDLYLSEEQEQHVIDAIAEAEKRTSGEIRIHLEQHCDREPLVRAARIFHELGMDQTQQQNGVLIYVATEDHQIAVYAGKGIHEQVEDGFWEDIVHLMTEQFKKDEFEKGIADAVRMVGQKLEELFPYQKGDINELTDEISYHDNSEE